MDSRRNLGVESRRSRWVSSVCHRLRWPTITTTTKATTPGHPSQVDHQGGFVWTTADEAYQLRVGGYLQARWSVDQHEDDRDNGFALGRVRPVIDGTGEYGLGFHVMGELAGDPELLEGWLEWREGFVGVRAGAIASRSCARR